ncbi:MAG: toll/interleukin-1 receptor domain-containing protein, partial [bacterium]|nr:toll/interleukin-1 receptor domain-containing protein [bacterium]
MSDFDVFLSHNSKDKPAVRDLAEALRARGLKVWLDEWELIPGRPWQEALEKIIKTVPCTAVLVSKDGLGPWEIPEMRAALSQYVKRGSPIIPVLLPGCPKAPELPLFLEQFTWVDLHDGLTPEGLDRLVWGITGHKPKPQTTPPPPPPRSAVRVSISRLPTPGPHFVARGDELRRLDDAWDHPHQHLVSIV